MSDIVVCACGCGTEIPRIGINGEIRKYVHNHHRSTPERLAELARCKAGYEAKEQWSCRCGCGQVIERYYRSGNKYLERQFVHNHHKRGVPASETQKAAIRKLTATDNWKQRLLNGLERRRDNPNWKRSVTSEAAYQKWNTRGRSLVSHLVCAECGKDIHRRQHAILKQRYYFCTSLCRGLFYSGARHPLYRHDKGTYGPDWTASLRRQIKERDGNMCQVCRATRRLVVHHLNEDKSNSAADNLMTLCRSCHSRLHSSKAMIPRLKHDV